MLFSLKATRCKFENSGVPGIGRTMSFLMFSDDIAKENIEASNGAELSAAMSAFAFKHAPAKGSFFVTEFLHRKQRAFPGYRKQDWTLKFDRDPKGQERDPTCVLCEFGDEPHEH